MTEENKSENADDFLDEIMCNCSGTTRGDIVTLFVQGLDMDAISRKTGALSGCSGCEWDVQQFLKELAKQENSASQK